LKAGGRVELRPGETGEATTESRVEIDGPLKELLGESVVARTELTQMPQAALVCGQGVKALWRLANSTLHLGVGDGRSDGNVTASVISSWTAKISASAQS